MCPVQGGTNAPHPQFLEVKLHPAHQDSTGALKPLSPSSTVSSGDVITELHALTAELQYEDFPSSGEEVSLLMEVQRGKECLIGFHVPPSWSQKHHMGAGNLEASILSELKLALRLPLSTAFARRVDGAPGSGHQARYLVALRLAPLENLSCMKALQIGSGSRAFPSEPGGTWLLSCRSEEDRALLLERLQMAGCIMNGVEDRYEIGQLVGVGSSARVYLAEDLVKGGPVAIKFVTRSGSCRDEVLLREAQILRMVRHSSILEFHGIYFGEDAMMGNKTWAIITEFVGGGELFDEVKRTGALPEERAKHVINQILSAMNFLHQRGIVHRDIKTENVILTGVEDQIKVVDFGLAAPEWDRETMKQRCGSPGYIAPEVLKGQGCDCKVDCFAIGVLAYILLAGQGPFRGKTMMEMLQSNLRCKVDWDCLSHISSPGRSFVMGLLEADPANRPSADEALRHRWLVRCTQASSSSSADESHTNSRSSGSKSRRILSRELLFTDVFDHDRPLRVTSRSCSPQRNCSPEKQADSIIGEHASASMFLGNDQLATCSDLGDVPDDVTKQDTPLSLKTSPRASLQVSKDCVALDDVADKSLADRVTFEHAGPVDEPGNDLSNGPVMDVDILTDSTLRSCTQSQEPLWADVQRTLNMFRVNGIVPKNRTGAELFRERMAYRGNRGFRRDGDDRSESPSDRLDPAERPSEDYGRTSYFFTHVQDVQDRPSGFQAMRSSREDEHVDSRDGGDDGCVINAADLDLLHRECHSVCQPPPSRSPSAGGRRPRCCRQISSRTSSRRPSTREATQQAVHEIRRDIRSSSKIAPPRLATDRPWQPPEEIEPASASTHLPEKQGARKHNDEASVLARPSHVPAARDPFSKEEKPPSPTTTPARRRVPVRHFSRFSSDETAGPAARMPKEPKRISCAAIASPRQSVAANASPRQSIEQRSVGEVTNQPYYLPSPRESFERRPVFHAAKALAAKAHVTGVPVSPKTERGSFCKRKGAGALPQAGLSLVHQSPAVIQKSSERPSVDKLFSRMRNSALKDLASAKKAEPFDDELGERLTDTGRKTDASIILLKDKEEQHIDGLPGQCPALVKDCLPSIGVDCTSRQTARKTVEPLYSSSGGSNGGAMIAGGIERLSHESRGGRLSDISFSQKSTDSRQGSFRGQHSGERESLVQGAHAYCQLKLNRVKNICQVEHATSIPPLSARRDFSRMTPVTPTSPTQLHQPMRRMYLRADARQA